MVHGRALMVQRLSISQCNYVVQSTCNGILPLAISIRGLTHNSVSNDFQYFETDRLMHIVSNLFNIEVSSVFWSICFM